MLVKQFLLPFFALLERHFLQSPLFLLLLELLVCFLLPKLIDFELVGVEVLLPLLLLLFVLFSFLCLLQLLGLLLEGFLLLHLFQILLQLHGIFLPLYGFELLLFGQGCWLWFYLVDCPLRLAPALVPLLLAVILGQLARGHYFGVLVKLVVLRPTLGLILYLGFSLLLGQLGSDGLWYLDEVVAFPYLDAGSHDVHTR